MTQPKLNPAIPQLPSGDVENIQPLFEEFQKNKAPFRYELTQQPWGMNEMQIDDPYGNAIKFGEPSK